MHTGKVINLLNTKPNTHNPPIHKQEITPPSRDTLQSAAHFCETLKGIIAHRTYLYYHIIDTQKIDTLH